MGLTHSFLQPRRLKESDSLQGFSCGISFIDNWAHERASSAAKHGTAVPYISTTTEGEIAGFYTLSAYSVNRDSVLGGWLRRNTPDRIPAILIGMLSVDQRFQGEGLGWRLLQDAIICAHAISQQLGSRAIIVDPYDDSSRSFYEHFGFKPIPGSDSLYLKLS